VIALATFNRIVLLQMRGFASFGRRLIDDHDVTSLTLGRASFAGADFERLLHIAVSFQRRLQRSGIPKYMLEYSDVPSLLSIYDRRAKASQ
jgi:hypothetical protein